MSLPERPTRSYHRAMFMAAAVWAGGFALLGLVLGNIFPEKMTLLLTNVPNLSITANLFFALVLVFGVSYYWAALDTLGNISIIKLGIWGKLAVFAMVTLGYIRGEATLLTMLGGIGELVFVGLFLRVLRDLRSSASRCHAATGAD